MPKTKIIDIDKFNLRCIQCRVKTCRNPRRIKK